MMTFFRRNHHGNMRGSRIGLACLLVVFALLSLIGNGWRSISWMAWFLMAFGLFAISQVADGRKSERSKWHWADKRNWHSPTYLVGFAAYLLGGGLLLYRAFYHH
jgi:uncharacterized membrane protein